jgi:hypothetical protein
MTLTSVTITGAWKTPSGDNATGRVRFRLTSTLRDAATNTAISAYETVATLATGAISVALKANDDPTTVPSGSTYLVHEELVGSPVQTYEIVVPYNAGATVDLADLTHTTTGVALLNPLTGLGHGLYWAADNGFTVTASDGTTRAANSAAWDTFWARSDVTQTYRTIAFTDATSGTVTKNAALSAGGATLVFGPGEWWFNDLTTPLGPYQCVEGMGKHLTTLRITSGKLRVGTTASTQNRGGFIKDLTVDGRDVNGTATSTTLIEMGVCSEWVVENVQFIGKATNAMNAYGTSVNSTTTQAAALCLRGTQNATVKNCLFNTIAGTAVLLDEGAARITLEDCFWSGCGEDIRAGSATGASGTGAQNCAVRGGIIERDTYTHDKHFSVMLQSFDNFQFENVIFSLNQCPANHNSVTGSGRYPAIICLSNELAVSTQERLVIKDCWFSGSGAGTDDGTALVYATTGTLTSATTTLGGGVVAKYIVVFEGSNWPSGMSWGVVVNSVTEVLTIVNGLVNLTGIKAGNEYSLISGSTAGGWAAVTNGWNIRTKAYMSAGAILLGKRDTGSSLGPNNYRGFYTYPGTPNANITAGANSLCIDITNGALYYNTSTPGTPSAAWTAVTLP